jgi:hypothetical protein
VQLGVADRVGGLATAVVAQEVADGDVLGRGTDPLGDVLRYRIVEVEVALLLGDADEGGAVCLGDGHDPAGLFGCPPVEVPLADDLTMSGDEEALGLGGRLGGDLFELGRIEAEFRWICL